MPPSIPHARLAWFLVQMCPDVHQAAPDNFSLRVVFKISFCAPKLADTGSLPSISALSFNLCEGEEYRLQHGILPPSPNTSEVFGRTVIHHFINHHVIISSVLTMKRHIETLDTP